MFMHSRLSQSIMLFIRLFADHDLEQECGDEIYGDFDNSDPYAVEALAKGLQTPNIATMSPGAADTSGGQSIPTGEPSNSQEIELTVLSPQTTQSSNQHSEAEPSLALSSLNSTAPEESDEILKFVAICVNTSSIKTLEEVEVSTVKTDEQLFDLMKKAYHDRRGWRTKFRFLVGPADMQYVRVSQLLSAVKS